MEEDKDEKSSQSTLTETEKLYLSIGTLSVSDEEFERLWTEHPNEAKRMLIEIGRQAVEGDEEDD